MSSDVQPGDGRCLKLRTVAMVALQQPESSWAAIANGADVPVTTLRRWTQALAQGQAELRRGAPTLLTLSEEQCLVGVALMRQSLNAPLTKYAMGKLASQLLAKRDKQFAKGRPSDEWWTKFLQRWPGLSLRKPSNLSTQALTRATTENLKPWFEKAAPLLRTIGRHLWHNVDEGQVTVDKGAKLVIAARGSQHVHAEKAGYSNHVTIVPCVSATGVVLPTCWIFKGKRAAPELLDGAGPQDCIATTGEPVLLLATLVH